MLKKTITYTDYNGVERTDDCYFNLTEAELYEWELSAAGGFFEMLQRIINEKDVPTIAKTFKDLIFKAYGVKSPDGKRFIKSPELSTEFSQTEAYNQLYVELLTSDVAAAEFVNGLMPPKLVEKMKASNVN